jgi:hypothetical protein
VRAFDAVGIQWGEGDVPTIRFYCQLAGHALDLKIGCGGGDGGKARAISTLSRMSAYLSRRAIRKLLKILVCIGFSEVCSRIQDSFTLGLMLL